MAEKINWHRRGTKLRHGHRMYRPQSSNNGDEQSSQGIRATEAQPVAIHVNSSCVHIIIILDFLDLQESLLKGKGSPYSITECIGFRS